MNGKIITVKVIEKETEMKNRANNEYHTKDQVHRERNFTGGSYNISAFSGKVELDRTTRKYTTYDNYTVTKAVLLDENTNKKYDIKVVKDDFLPTVGKNIKVFDSENEPIGIISYIPYKNAEPISIQTRPKNFSLETLFFFLGNLIAAGIPILSFYTGILFLLNPEKTFKDGIIKNANITRILGVIIVSIQTFICYTLYTKGVKVIPEMFQLSVLGGILTAVFMVLFEIVKNINISRYINYSLNELKNTEVK